ncbi:MAG: hypothetical protein JWN86_4055 [Planctomycetota bacterium]|nr:hypothetical protein [Planctomycetota bacterium]
MIAAFRPLALAAFLFVSALGFNVSAQNVTKAENTPSRSKVIDEAGLFSKTAVETATKTLEKAEREWNVPVTIEVVESLGGESIEEAAMKNARLSGGQGLMILIAKKERKISTPLVRRQFEHRFPADRRAAIREAILSGFKEGNFDEGLHRGVAAIVDTLKATASEKHASPLIERDRIRLTLAGARKALAAAEAKAAEMNLKMNIAVVDDGGHLLAFARMDGARPASAATAQTKAISAATMRQATGPIPPRSTSPDLIVNLGLSAAAASGGARVTTLYGGVPIVIDGQVVGAVGVGGATGEQDAEVAQAGAAALAEDSKKAVEK